mgnify:CR=1 FL=1|jgi:hypothetical protein
MSKIVNVIIVIIAVANVVYSFWKYSDSISFFGFEVNIWVYRLFWSLIAIGIFYDYSKKKKVS